jgi:hypothetical protein
MIAFRREDVEASEIERSQSNASLPRWLSASVVVGALLMAAGGIIALAHPAMLVSANAQINVATRVYAGYLASRNLALAGMLLVTLAMGTRSVLGSLMMLTAFIQLLDAGMDFVEGRWTLVPGVLLFAMVFFLGSARLSGRSVWKFAAAPRES